MNFYHLQTLTNDPSFCKSSASASQSQPRMAVKKNSPFAGGLSSAEKPERKSLKTKDLSRRHDASDLPAGSFDDEQLLFKNSASMICSDQRTLFNDPAQVRQWAVNSATGSSASADMTGYVHYSASYGIDQSMTTVSPPMPGCVSVLRPDTSRVSFPHVPHVPESNGAELKYDAFSPIGAGNATSPLDSGLGFLPFQDIDNNLGAMDEQFSPEFWQFSSPTADENLFSNQVAPSLSAMEGRNDNSGYHSGWSLAPIQTGDEMLNTVAPCPAYPTACSPLSAVDPSISSSFSHSSFLGPQPNTPISPVFQEGNWLAEQTGALEENAMFPAFTIGESMERAFSSDRANEQIENLRLVGDIVGGVRYLTLPTVH